MREHRTYVENGEIFQDVFQLLVDSCLCELDLSHIKTTNSRYGQVLMDLSWGLTLGTREDDIHKLFAGRNDLDPLEVVHGVLKFPSTPKC